MAKQSPMSRTLCWLRKNGWVPAIVEHRNPYAHITQDLYGFADIIAFHSLQCEIALVQCTTRSNMSSRRKKILREPRAEGWLDAGGIIMLVGWSKKGPRGMAKHWAVDMEMITNETFSGIRDYAMDSAPSNEGTNP